MSELRIMAGHVDQIKDSLPPGVEVTTGDTKVIWSSGNRDEVDAAKETFNRLKKKGFLAYAVKRDGEKGEVLHEFDAEVQKIIMAPPMKGG